MIVTYGRVSILHWDWGLGVRGRVGGGGEDVGGGGKNRGTFVTSLHLAFRRLDGNPSPYTCTSVNSDAISS